MAKELHFYPGIKTMAFISKTDKGTALLLKCTAIGGPQTGGSDTRMKEIPTTPGKYIIKNMEAYRTDSWTYSKIKWGTKLKDMPKETVKITHKNGITKTYIGDIWYKLPSGKYGSVGKDLSLTRDKIIKKNMDLYGKNEVPSEWIFNDFGPIAIRYFKDSNNNKIFDGNEKLMGEMIHTTPVNEAEQFQGYTVDLVESHGCVHIKPSDRDKLKVLGAFKKGTSFIVHKYTEVYRP